MVDSIVVAVTGAPVAVRAVRWAVQRAQAAPPGSQRIELLSVVGGVLGTVGEAAVLEQAVAATETLLERLAEPVRDAGIPVVCRAEAGDPVSRLIDASSNDPSDRADLHGLLCRKALKGSSLPAALLRASAQIRSDHSNQINRS